MICYQVRPKRLATLVPSWRRSPGYSSKQLPLPSRSHRHLAKAEYYATQRPLPPTKISGAVALAFHLLDSAGSRRRSCDWSASSPVVRHAQRSATHSSAGRLPTGFSGAMTMERGAMLFSSHEFILVFFATRTRRVFRHASLRKQIFRLFWLIGASLTFYAVPEGPVPANQSEASSGNENTTISPMLDAIAWCSGSYKPNGSSKPPSDFTGSRDGGRPIRERMRLRIRIQTPQSKLQMRKPMFISNRRAVWY